MPPLHGDQMIGTATLLNLSEVGKTNHCHSEQEKQMIRETICRTNEALLRLEMDKRAILLRLESDLERYLNAISPIRQLPIDILCCIFEWHCQDALPMKLPLQSMPPQVALSQVCSVWRQIILDMPKLWSNISIDPDRAGASFDNVVGIANEWLSRAKYLPCSIESLFAVNHYTHWKQHWDLDIIKNFFSVHRFKKLGAAFTDRHIRDLLQLPDEKLSCIEDLCIQRVDVDDVDDDDDDEGDLEFRKLVNLTSFSLSPHPFRATQHARSVWKEMLKFADFPWHQLRHIQLRVAMPAPFCLNIFEHCSAVLETCSFVVRNNFLEADSVTLPYCKGPIHCRQLKYLTMDATSTAASFDNFLLLLLLPKLKSLIIGSDGSPGMPTDPHTLLTMHSVSNMPLEELVISCTAFDIDVGVLLKKFPLLRRLQLPMKSKFSAATVCALEAGTLGAFLEDLTIRDTDVDIKTLLQMIKARSSVQKEGTAEQVGPTPFKSVVLFCPDLTGTLQIEVSQVIEEINRLGVSLKVNFPAHSDDESISDPYEVEYDDEYSEYQADEYDDEYPEDQEDGYESYDNESSDVTSL